MPIVSHVSTFMGRNGPKMPIFGPKEPKMHILDQIWPFFVPFRPMPVGTWDTLGIKIPKPPYISSLKMVGFVHFSNFLIPSEKYYKLQFCWITLYLWQFKWKIFWIRTSHKKYGKMVNRKDSPVKWFKTFGETYNSEQRFNIHIFQKNGMLEKG